jgi:hypothetical protein
MTIRISASGPLVTQRTRDACVVELQGSQTGAEQRRRRWSGGGWRSGGTSQDRPPESRRGT